MLQYERQQDILRYLENQHIATVGQLAEAVYTSESSVRRDLSILEKQGMVCRVYSGVILAKYRIANVPFMLRKMENIAQKQYIAEKASGLLFDGATIFIDGSSTAGMLTKYLDRFQNIKVITNSSTVVEEASKYLDYIWLTGGRYNRDDRTFVGPEAEKFVRALNIDLFFFSSQGITEAGEINDSSETDNSFRRVVMERSSRKIFLCDSSKVGIHRMFKLCTRFEIDGIICEKPLPWENAKSE